MRYWLFKSEGDCYPISQLKKDGVAPWSGVRNYQARNFIRDEVSVGDLVLFYHSNAKPSGIYGLAQVVSQAYPDITQFNPKDEHFDPQSKPDNPRWFVVDVKYKTTFSKPLSLEQIKHHTVLKNMVVAQPGSRLSIMPVTEKHFTLVQSMCR